MIRGGGPCKDRRLLDPALSLLNSPYKDSEFSYI